VHPARPDDRTFATSAKSPAALVPLSSGLRGAGAKARRRRGGDPRVPERVPERWRRAVSRLAPGSSAGQHRRGRRGGRDPV